MQENYHGCKKEVQGLQIIWNLKLLPDFLLLSVPFIDACSVLVFLSLCMQMDWYFAILIINSLVVHSYLGG